MLRALQVVRVGAGPASHRARLAEIPPNVGAVPYGGAVDESAAINTLPAEPETDVPKGPALSPSRAADFMTCPLLYRFRVIDRLPEPPTPATARGTLVHAALERLFDLPAAERTPEAARALLIPEWDRLAAGLRLRGYIDRLDVAPGGEIRIVDYKTGRAPREAYEASALFQMKFYALVIWRLRGVVPRLLQLMYLAEGEVLRYSPDESDLLATERKVAALWKAIERARDAGDWRPRPSRLCDWCNHKALCPEFGGTPPPLPESASVSEALPSHQEAIPEPSLPEP